MASTIPVALITGTNSGLGLALTVAMSKTHRVYAGMRSLSKRTELDEALGKSGGAANVVVTVIDVNSDDSVNTCVKDILAKEDRLDVLFCNAGYAVVGSVESIEMKAVKDQFNTNVFGVVRCQKAVLPQMRKQKSGHILVTSSVGGVFGQPFNDIYCASKFAVEGMFEAQAPMFRKLGIYTTSVQPGGILSKFGENAKLPENMPDEYKAGFMATLGAYAQTAPPAHDGVTIACTANRQTPEELAEIIIEKAISLDKPPAKLQVNPEIQPLFDNCLTDPTGELNVKMVTEGFLQNVPGPSKE